MKKFLLEYKAVGIILLLVLIGGVFLFVEARRRETVDFSRQELQGYYWNGFVDETPPLELNLLGSYYFNLDSNFSDYQINGEDFSWYSLDAKTEGLENGDYIQVFYSGPILQSYPARFSKIEEIRIIEPR